VTDFSFNNPRYMDILNRQVISMDQGACYNPEFLVSRNMHDYPSRMMQIARAVWLGQLEASKYGADVVFGSILSGQGERWQNFGETPHHYLWCQMISRAMFAERSLAPEFPVFLQENAKSDEKWSRAFPSLDGDTTLLIDHASYIYAADSASALAAFLSRKGIRTSGYGPYDTGWQELATGQLSLGIERLQLLLARLASEGTRRVITASAEGHYMLTVMAEELGLTHDIEVVNILNIADRMDTKQAYVYGGGLYTRYLGLAERLMQLTPNTQELPIANYWEFQPIYDGDARVNKINKWTPPLCAEFFDTPEKSVFSERIFEMTASRIAEIPHSQLVIMDAHAYSMAIRYQFEKNKLMFYWDVLR